MSLISVSNLTFGYEGSYENIFENASFSIDSDWKLGFVGRNGRGKTTFLKLLMGEYEYSGTIAAAESFEYFPRAIDDEDRIVTEIISEICGGCPEWQIFRELNLLQVDEGVLYRPFSTLSMGERTKCLLAAMFLRPDGFMLIDEPTNHLDSEGRRILGDYLSRKKGFILVSHDRKLLDRAVDHVISINRADIEIIKGNYSVWEENRRLRDNFELAENERLKKDIKRLENAAKQAEKWSDTAESRKIGFDPRRTEKSIGRRSYEGAKAKKAAARSKSFGERARKAAEEKSALLKNIEKTDSLKLAPLEYRSAVICEVKGFKPMFEGTADRLDSVSFEIKRGERISLRGRNGSGKSSVIKAIAGIDIPHIGSVVKGSGVTVSYVPQSSEELRGSLKEYADRYGIDHSLFLTVLRKLDLSRSQFELPMESFSGGQKKKVMIARSLCEKAHLYIWDEPLNFIDVLSRIQIEELLLEYKPTMLFVEHDEVFSEKIADKTVSLY